MKEKEHKVLLLIGNGFDCDLGLKTKYKDFVESVYFQNNVTCKFDPDRLIESDYDFNIFDYLYYRYNENNNWIDIEHELAELATRKSITFDESSGRNIYVKPVMGKEQKVSFMQLKKNLNDYISSLDAPAKRTTYANKLAEIISKSDHSKVISFNYTNFELTTGISLSKPCYYVHGCLNDNVEPSIILGFQDDVDIDKSYCCMIKSHQPSYYASHIPDYLEDVDEVIFFGLSLGDVDYPYFSDFFKKQCIPNDVKNRKFISFFTYDEDSRQDILYQLRMMNDKRTRHFFEYSNLNFFRTKNNMDNDKIEGFFQDLRKRLGFIEATE